MEDEILFWQTRIKITQAPQPFEPKEIPKNLILPYQRPLEIRSFLYDPFGGSLIGSYGLELTANDRLDVVFFTKAESKSEAIKLGYAWLLDLKYKFLGLDGIVKAKPIRSNDIEDCDQNKLIEIVIPEGVITDKIKIIKRFINIFYNNKKNNIQLFILWQKTPPSKKSYDPEPDFYYLRIFIKYSLDISDIDNYLKFMGNIKFLVMDIETTHMKRANVIKSSDVSLLDVFEGNIFNNNNICSVSKLHGKFDFPDSLPLPKLPILENENVRYVDLNDEFKKKAIKVGLHVKNGVITNNETYVPINKLPQDIDIFGKPGSGKTYFLARFIEELCIKAENVGILILNVAKESQGIYYSKNFTIIKYSDDAFHIPYYIDVEAYSLKKHLQETATYICASLGLKNVFEKIIYRTEIGFIELEGKLPEKFYSLLKGVENYMTKNPYGPEEQANLIQAFRNRMRTFDEKKVQEVLKLSEDLPQWVIDWMDGKKIFLDLSMCSKFIKLLIVNAIFQLIRTLTKDIEAEELRHLIVIDEAHAILEKPITTNADDADFITKEQMAKIFSELLKEYRSRGVGFIVADQSPDHLFDDVASQPSVKVLFRLDYPDNLLFSEDPKERQMLSQLENRLALIINGATGERYLIKSLDYKI